MRGSPLSNIQKSRTVLGGDDVGLNAVILAPAKLDFEFLKGDFPSWANALIYKNSLAMCF
jgi:hypothetical protein